jgi:hypothetical protein
LELWRPAGTQAALPGFSSSNASSGNDVTSDTLGQTAAALGGKIGSDGKTHFFLAGEFSCEDRASPVTSPLAPENYVGHYRGWLGFLRLDRQLNERNNAFLRLNMDHFYDTNPNGTVCTIAGLPTTSFPENVSLLSQRLAVGMGCRPGRIILF